MDKMNFRQGFDHQSMSLSLASLRAQIPSPGFLEAQRLTSPNFYIYMGSYRFHRARLPLLEDMPTRNYFPASIGVKSKVILFSAKGSNTAVFSDNNNNISMNNIHPILTLVVENYYLKIVW